MKYIVKYCGASGYRETARQLEELRAARRELREARRAIRSRA